MTRGACSTRLAAVESSGRDFVIPKRRNVFPKGVRRARLGPLPPLVVPRAGRANLFDNSPATLPVGVNWPAVREGSRSLYFAAPLDPCQDAAQHFAQPLETSVLLACRHVSEGRRFDVQEVVPAFQGQHV